MDGTSHAPDGEGNDRCLRVARGKARSRCRRAPTGRAATRDSLAVQLVAQTRWCLRAPASGSDPGQTRLEYILDLYKSHLLDWQDARVRRPWRPGPAKDPRAAHRWGAGLGGDHRDRPGRVRDLAAGRLAAPQGAPRQRLRDASGRKAPDGSTPSNRRRCTRSTLARPVPPLLGTTARLTRDRARAWQT